ncbi:MAG: C10 family peptidase [Bacteroides sp.]|nr:C10 family peptidase [Bacteroides sp.]MCM1378641.1 C10 family peptidase [Bacteroides sp.]MCM1446385.1 C10 family peptidase [Prevotella sp.]
MKKPIILLFAILADVTLSAEVLAPAQALQRVCDSTTAAGPRKVAKRAVANASPARVVAQYNADPELYVFTPAGGGVLLVSAESEAPALLGYTESTLADGNIPPAMEYMMNCYAEEINALRDGNVIYGDSRADNSEDFAPIDIVCPTTWDQGGPYYDMCPERTDGFNPHFATGCVATAIAQVLYTHKYPARCVGGEYSYQWTKTDVQPEETKTLSINFDEVELDWDNMLHSYPNGGADATQQQKDAVATLMKAVGYASNMNYGPGGSGTHGFVLAAGLVKYFDFDITTRVYQRRWVPMPQWKKMIYDELADGHAVYMDAQTGLTLPSAHAFMIDGYQGNGFFHVNWGWGGMSNGYFLLTTMEPGAQGIGGAAVPSGYCAQQGIIIGLKHGRTGDIEDAEPQFFITDQFKPSAETAKLGSKVNFSGTTCYNIGALVDAKRVAPGVKFTREDGTVYWAHENVEIDVPSSISGALYGLKLPTVTIPADLPEGNYTISPAVYSHRLEKHFDIATCVGQGGTSKATVSGGNITFEAIKTATLKLEVDPQTTPKLVYNKDNSVNCRITNTSDVDYDGYIYTRLVKRGETKVRADLNRFHVNVEPGKTVEVAAKLVLDNNTVGSGNYELLFQDQNQKGFISDPIPVKVNGYFSAAELTAEGIVCVSNAQNDLQFDVSLTATEGDFDNYLYLKICVGKDEVTSIRQPKALIPYETTETVRFTGKFPEGVIGKKYTVFICYKRPDGIKEAVGNKRYLTFELSERNTIDSAIDRVDAGVPAGSQAEYFDLSGRRVDNPVKGVYLMRVGGQTTKVKF